MLLRYLPKDGFCAVKDCLRLAESDMLQDIVASRKDRVEIGGRMLSRLPAFPPATKIAR